MIKILNFIGLLYYDSVYETLYFIGQNSLYFGWNVVFHKYIIVFYK